MGPFPLLQYAMAEAACDWRPAQTTAGPAERSGKYELLTARCGAATGKGKLRAALADFQCLPLFIFKPFPMCMGTSWSHVTQAGLDYVAEDDL